MRGTGTEQLHSRDEGSVMEFVTEGAALFSPGVRLNQQWEEPRG